MSDTRAYHEATDAERAEWEGSEDYSLLVGPNGFRCFLGEPEDREWYRDAADVVDELNRLHEEVQGSKKVNVDAPDGVEHRSCEGCVHRDSFYHYLSRRTSPRRPSCFNCWSNLTLDPKTRDDNCLRKNWTAPEPTPAPVPMTPEYAATMIGRALDMEGSWSLTIRWVGTYGIRDRCGNERTYAEIAERGMWQDDGTPCAMPAGDTA